ncbi:MAG TPA: serine/threonine-protein kinase, partial [Pirellulaceae bacterium]|nr:serine/threonine-protein kinase [Pirellulaceae bacterium]
EELKLLQRAVAAGLLPAESLERALNQSGDGDSLFQHLAGDGRLSAPELDLVRQLSVSRALPAQPNASPSAADTSPDSPAAEHDTTPAPAEVVRLPGLPERYERLKSIGSGGMGWVFSAHDSKLKRDVAIKVLKGERVGDSWTKMMLRESEVLARLKHPGLVPIYDVGHLADDSPYLVMPYVTGVNLDEYAAARSLSWRECVSIMRQIAEAVGHAHLVNIVHRDLKPGNIRITPEGSAVVLDFGIAKPVTDAGDSNVAETVSSGSTADPLDGAQVWKPSYETCGPGGAGTPSYMSPEQAAGDAVDLRTDVYSLGVVMYYLLAGRLPWPREVYLER